MDPYEFAQKQGQTIGSRAQPEELADAVDLMDLLLGAYNAAGRTVDMSEQGKEAVAGFAVFGNEYLATHRVVSTGVVNGEFSLVFESGHAVPLASREAIPARPDSTVPITRPRDSQMKGLPVADSSVPMTTGLAGSPVRKPG